MRSHTNPNLHPYPHHYRYPYPNCLNRLSLAADELKNAKDEAYNQRQAVNASGGESGTNPNPNPNGRQLALRLESQSAAAVTATKEERIKEGILSARHESMMVERKNSLRDVQPNPNPNPNPNWRKNSLRDVQAEYNEILDELEGD